MSIKTETSNININWMEILVLRKNIKNFHLNVLPPDWEVRISVPLWTSDETIRNFAVTRMPRIKKKSIKYTWKPRQTKREYVTWESHYFKWNRYLLDVIQHNAPAKIEIKGKKKLNFYVSPNHTVTDKEKFMTNRYRKELKKELTELIDKREKITGIKCNKWWIRKMKTMWGSCNQSEKVLWFNLELIKKPIECVEYVVLHELIHILERTHNEFFVGKLDEYMPKWRLYKDELNWFIL